MDDLLTECSDMTLVCDDGVTVPCSKFLVLSNCGLFAGMRDVITIDKSVRVPNVDSTAVRLAVGVVHGVVDVDAVSLPDATLAHRGLDLMDCPRLASRVMARIWDLVKDDALDGLRGYLPGLLRHPECQMHVVRRLAMLVPMWTDMQRVLGALDMDYTLAAYLVARLSKLYPTASLFRTLVRKIPKATVTVSGVIDVVTAMSGVFVHPGEVTEILDETTRHLSNTDSQTTKLLGVMRTALHHYDAAPTIALNLSGTVLAYHDAPTVSVYLTFSALVKCTRKITPWLTLRVDTAEGVLESDIRPNKFDKRHYVRGFELRFVAFGAACAEVWYMFGEDHPQGVLNLSDAVDVYGSYDAVTECMKRPDARLRIDVFYGVHSAYHRADTMIL